MGVEEAVAVPLVAEGASKGAEAAGGALLPEAGIGAGQAAGVAGEGAAKGAEAAAGGALSPAGGPLDLLAGGAGAGTATPSAVGTIVPFAEAGQGALSSGLALEQAGAELGGGLGFAGGSATFGADPGGGALDFSARSAGGTNTDVLGATSGGAPAGPGAQSISGVPGVNAPADPTAFNAIDAQAGQPGVNGFPGQAPATGATPGATPQSSGFSLDKLVSGATNQITKNPLGIAAGLGGLAYTMSQGQQKLPSTKTLEEQAGALNAQGKQLAAYLQSGTLPDGLKSQLQQATKGAKAAVMSNFAKQGMSTDPSKNSALAAQLAQIDQQAIITTATIGQSLLTTGINESGMASKLYETLANIDQTQTANIGKAIAGMAAAFGGGGNTIKIG